MTELPPEGTTVEVTIKGEVDKLCYDGFYLLVSKDGKRYRMYVYPEAATELKVVEGACYPVPLKFSEIVQLRSLTSSRVGLSDLDKKLYAAQTSLITRSK